MVETMVSDSHFQKQLASIMEMLAKTAVLEIGKLVEETHAVFRREISRKICENDALKKKCDLLESNLKASRRSAVHNKETGHCPTIDSVFGKEWCMDLWRDKQPSAVQKRQNYNPCKMESVDLREGDDDGDDDEEEQDMAINKDETVDAAGKNKPPENLKGSEKAPTFPAMEKVVDQMSEDFVPSLAALGNTQSPCPDKQILDVGADQIATSSSVTSEDFGMLVPNTMPLNIQQTFMSVPEPKKFECVFCGKNFSYLSYLKAHLRTHSGEKPFVCTVCGKRFARKTYLKIHLRTHSGERPYSCTECAKSFSQKSSLNIHLRSHTGEKPYSCVDCGKRYAYKHGFNIHQCNS